MNIALILSGGTGTCFGFSKPRQYLYAGDKMVISHSLQVFGAHPQIDAIQIVAEEQWREVICSQMSEVALRKFKGFSKPGPSRQRSIFYGLNAMAQYARKSDIVIIHDAVRPVVSPSVISACVEACKKHDGALPVLPVPDTVYLGKEGSVTSLLKSDRAYIGQVPAAFRLGKYYGANRSFLPDDMDRIIDVAEPAYAAGMDIAMVPGDEESFTIVTRIDLERFRMVVRRS